MDFNAPSERDPDESLSRDLLEIREMSVDNAVWLTRRSADVYAAIQKGLESEYHYGAVIETIFELLALVMTDVAWKPWFEPVITLVEHHSLHESNLFEIGFREVMHDFRAVLGLVGSLDSVKPILVEEMLKAYTKLIKVIFYRQGMKLQSTLLEQAFAIAKRLGDHIETAQLHQTLAIYYNHYGDYRLAELYGRQAFISYQQVDDPIGSADAACTLAIIYRTEVRISQADYYITKAVSQIPENSYDRRYATLYYENGVLHYRRNEFTLALKFYRQALDIFEEYEAAYQIAMSQQAMAQVYLNLGDFEQAETLLFTARQTWVRLGIKYEWVNSIFVEADLELKRGSPTLALTLMRQAIDQANAVLEEGPARDHLIELMRKYIQKHS